MRGRVVRGARDVDRLFERWPHPQNTFGLTRLEVITGWADGIEPTAPDIALVPPVDPRRAIEQALHPALSRTPCCVGFSGGRDSSVILALATQLARRWGLADPVPVTMVFGDVADTQEEDWQRMVLEHLQLSEWERVNAPSVDLLGDDWKAMFDEHGMLWPPTAHGYRPLLAAARGGSLMIGEGGDEVFGGWTRGRLAGIASGRHQVRLSDWRPAARALAPRGIRDVAEMVRAQTPAPWLSRFHRGVWAWHQGSVAASEPRTWHAYLRWARRYRENHLILQALERQASYFDVRPCAPFWDPGFLSSLGRWGGRFGRGGRTDLLLALFSDLLPEAVLRRTTKAVFTNAFFSRESRRFAEEWKGPVPEPDFVESEPLRQSWLSRYPPNTSAVLLQASWMLQQPLNGTGVKEMEHGGLPSSGPLATNRFE